MKNVLALITCLIMMTPIPASADAVSDLRESVQTVREKLVVLLVATDKEKQQQRLEEIKLISQDIDSKIESLQRRKISEKLAGNLTEFKLLWIEFKTTRDQEIIPRLLSGEQDKIKEAKTIARTIQAERFQKMQSLLQ